MNFLTTLGIIGSLILVVGAAWPEEKHVKHPIQSIKNWLFALGGLVMLAYSIFGYLAGGSIFYIFLEALVVLASIMMMANVPDNIDTPVIVVCGLGLIGWSLTLFTGYNTIFFIVGLSAIGLGYALEMGTVRRTFALTLGSALIALFSYIEASWIFFWLNIFFALFSAYYLYKGLSKK